MLLNIFANINMQKKLKIFNTKLLIVNLLLKNLATLQITSYF